MRQPLFVKTTRGKLAALAITLAFLLLSVNLIRADCTTTPEDCQSQIDQQKSQAATIQQQQADLQRQLDAATRNLNSTASQLADFQKKVSDIQSQLAKAEDDLKNAQGVLDKNKELFRIRVRDLYVRGTDSGWELLFGNSYSFADAAQFAGLKQAVINRNKELIVQYTSSVKNLADTKAQIADQVQTAQNQLAQIRAIKNAQAAQVASIQRSQSSLNTQLDQINSSIKNLTSQQQAIIAAKLAATSQGTTLGSGAPPTTTLPAAPFSPSFTFLTYGYPHRVGMSQYGAIGRAITGHQSYATILAAYFGVGPATRTDLPATISTNQGVKNFETDYMYGISEMESYWADQGGYEALKAQAVVSRTYALHYIGGIHGTGTICTSQTCQVYSAGKVTDPAAAKWRQAVDETRGQVIMSGSDVGGGYFSIGGAGYTCIDFLHLDPCVPALVDVSSGTSWSSGAAWDGPTNISYAWFHKAWGDRAGGSAYNPWLSATETADLFNALTLSQYDSSYNQYLTQPDKGGWSMQRVIDELHAKGLPEIGAVSSVAVGFDGRGNTSTISVAGANTSKTFDGKAFRAMFNLRSIGTLAVWTSFYDVQKSN